MSYYILPKISMNILINPCLHVSMDTPGTYISHSLNHYFNITKQNLNNLLKIEKTYTFKMLAQIINPYEYINLSPSQSSGSINKLKIKSRIFYDILEIFNTLNLYENIPRKKIFAIYYGKNSDSVLDYIKTARKDLMSEDVNVILNNINSNVDKIQSINNSIQHYNFQINEQLLSTCHFIYFELNEQDYKDTNDYVLGILSAIKCILLYQCTKGNAIIKIDRLYNKPLLDILYIICSLYDKVYIIKPNSSNILTDDRYLVCKTYHYSSNKNKYYFDKIHQICEICYKNRNDAVIQSIITNPISSYFFNKIEESNLIIGQQQLEAYTQMINILKNKNKTEKIENVQQHNIQKCIHWCEKYNLPCNKLQNVNVFLSNEPIEKHNDENISVYGCNPAVKKTDRLDELFTSNNNLLYK